MLTRDEAEMKRNPPDQTPRNTKASRNAEKDLKGRIKALESLVQTLHKDYAKRLNQLEADVRRVDGMLEQ